MGGSLGDGRRWRGSWIAAQRYVQRDGEHSKERNFGTSFPEEPAVAVTAIVSSCSWCWWRLCCRHRRWRQRRTPTLFVHLLAEQNSRLTDQSSGVDTTASRVVAVLKSWAIHSLTCNERPSEWTDATAAIEHNWSNSPRTERSCWV